MNFLFVNILSCSYRLDRNNLTDCDFDMSTQFPPFAPKTTNPLWFNVGEPGDDEAELRALEAKYRKWMKSIIDKDKDAPYIGKKPDAMPPNEPEPEGESEESEDEEDLNGFQDSPEDQNPGIQVDMDLDAAEEDTDNSWMI